MADTKISALSDAGDIQTGDQLVIARSGANNSVLGKRLPGYELAYNEVTTTVNLTVTTEGTAADVVTASAVTYDGSPVIVEFFCPRVATQNTSGSTIVFLLQESSTVIGRLGLFNTVANTTQLSPLLMRYRFTPSNASHTYKATAYSTISGSSLIGGAGGSGTELPMYLRITKV